MSIEGGNDRMIREIVSEPSNRNIYTIKISVDVADESVLFEAVMAQAQKDGLSKSDAQELLYCEGEISVPDCLIWLANPGGSWPGTRLDDVICE